MISSLFFRDPDVHAGWLPFLSAENREMLASIEAQVAGDDYTPPADKVLRFLKLPLPGVRIVILGQDPYPQPGVATGRAFEVGTLQSWASPFQNVSLKNILRAVYRAYTGEVISYNRLKERIFTDFPVLPPGELFTYWEEQGILLLNTSFTCMTGNPGSHQKLWEAFTGRLLEYISGNAPEATWFVWGNHAAKAVAGIRPQKAIHTLHPMMCYDTPGRYNDFLYGRQNCFEPFIDEIDWTGYAFRNKPPEQGKLF